MFTLENGQVISRIKRKCLAIVRFLEINPALFIQIYFHSSFFLSLFTAPKSFFRKGVNDSEVYTLLSPLMLSEGRLEIFLPATF